MFRNRIAELPAAVNGYELDPLVSFFSVVLPTGADVTNLIINPSFALATTGYTGVSGTLARDLTTVRRGVASGSLTPTANSGYVRYDSGLSLVAGTTYYFSVDVLVPAGVPMSLQFTDTGDAKIGQEFLFTGLGIWQRVSVAYTETANNTRRVRVLQNNSANRQTIYTDGWQVETTQLTSYLDGSLVGFVPGRTDYYWTGTPNGSTSVRIGQSASGGKVISLAQVGFRLMAIVGLGLGGITNFTTPKAIGGAFYNGTIISDREFSLAGKLFASSLGELQRQRQGLIDMLKPDRVSTPQPVVLRYAPVDDQGIQIGNEQEIVAVYDGDMSGSIDSRHQDGISLNFHLYLPFVAQEPGNKSSVLSFTTSITNANGIVQRSGTGLWSNMGAGVSGGTSAVTAVVRMPNGDIIAGGSFSAMAGVANTIAIARWDGTQWNAMGTGASGNKVHALFVAADGTLYAGGTFLAMGGVPSTAQIAKWNGSAWSALGSGGPGGVADVLAIAQDFYGNIIVGGNFTTMGGAANNNIAKWSGSAWSSIGTGFDNRVQALVEGPDRLMYVGGFFSNYSGGAVSRGLVKMDTAGPTITSIDTGVVGGTTGVACLAFGPDGTLYVGGDFTFAGPKAATGLAKVVGGLYAKVGNTLTAGTSGPFVVTMAWDYQTNSLWFGGNFGSAGGVPMNSFLGRWNGSAFNITDLILPGPGQIDAIYILPYGPAYIGFESSGTGSASGQTTVNNTGSAAIGPKLTVTGPGTLWWIKNWTTGKTIYFNHVTLIASEILTLDLSNPSKISVSDNLSGNAIASILPGSNLSDFTLAPGNNIISVFISGSTGATVVTGQWRVTHHSLDGSQIIRLVP